MTIIQIIATILVCLVVGVVTAGTVKQYYKNLIAASDADWRKKLKETIDEYESKLVKSVGSIVKLNSIIETKENIIKEHCATIERITETRDEYLELYHGSEVEISNLKDQLKEAEEANDILNKQLDEARECYEETRTELETNWGKKFNDIQEENSAMAQKIQDQALEIMDLKKQRDLADDIRNGKLEPKLLDPPELTKAMRAQMRLYKDLVNDDGLPHPYILDSADNQTLQDVTKFLRENGDRAKAMMDGRISEQMVEAIADEEPNIYIPSTTPDALEKLTETINDNYEKMRHERRCEL